MGCDYALLAPCKYRVELGREGLFDLHKTAVSFDTSHEYADGFVMVRTVYTPTGPQQKSFKLAELRAAVAKVKGMGEGDCKGCPFNLTGEGTGCHGYITYPIHYNLEMAIAKYISMEAAKLEHVVQSEFFTAMLSDYAVPNIELASRRARKMNPGITGGCNMEKNPIVFPTPHFPGGRCDMDWFWEAFFQPHDAIKEGSIIYSKRSRLLNSSFADGLGRFLLDEAKDPGLTQLTKYGPGALVQFATFCKAICIAQAHDVDISLLP